MRAVKNWVVATFILTFLVILAGAVVRTTQSGMGCPDWPRCFGKWIPPTTAAALPPDFEKYLRKQDIDHSFNALHTWIEYFNRLLGALLGVFAIIQLLLLFRRRKAASAAYKFAWAFLTVLILTGLFGAIVVKLNLAHLSISIHLLFALLLVQLQLALLLSLQGKMAQISIPVKVKRYLWGLLLIILIQSVLGTMVRIYIDDVSKIFDYSHRDQWLLRTPLIFLLHRSFSWIVLSGTLYITWYCRNMAALKSKLYALSASVLLAMTAGIVLYYAGMPAIAQPVHLLLASLVIALTASVLMQVRATGSTSR